MAFQQLTGRLYLRNVLKGILGNEKKTPGRKIQVKEIGCLLEGAKGLPAPLLTPFLGLQEDPLIAQTKGKMVLKGGIAPINAQWEKSPDGQPEKEP